MEGIDSWHRLPTNTAANNKPPRSQYTKYGKNTEDTFATLVSDTQGDVDYDELGQSLVASAAHPVSDGVVGVLSSYRSGKSQVTRHDWSRLQRRNAGPARNTWRHETW